MGRKVASVRAATAATTAEVQYLLCSSSTNCHSCQAACGQPKAFQGYELWRQQQIWESLSQVIFPAIVIAWFDQSIGAVTKLLQHITMFAHLTFLGTYISSYIHRSYTS
jgi:predicted acyl esterase